MGSGGQEQGAHTTSHASAISDSAPATGSLGTLAPPAGPAGRRWSFEAAALSPAGACTLSSLLPGAGGWLWLPGAEEERTPTGPVRRR